MATIKILLRDKPNADGLYPLVLRITKERKVKIITLGLDCMRKDWDSKESCFKKSYANYMQRNKVLLALKNKALTIIDNFYSEDIDFTLIQFEKAFRGKDKNKTTVLEFWDDKINDLIKVGRTGNARSLKGTKKSFFKFCNNDNILFREITTDLLYKYEVYLRANGNQDGGVGVKMRELRSIYNDAIRKGYVDEKYYPFKTFKVSRFKGKGHKKALSRDEIKLIENLDEASYPHLVEAKHYFLFSYFTRGMNFYDIMKLKWENIIDNKITYTRSKTKGRFVIEILKPVQDILDFYKGKNFQTNYVFPILLESNLTPSQIENRKFKTLKKFNKDLKSIGSVLGINKPITSYVARHSYATNLKQLGISTDIVSQSMGHSNLAVTISYLKEFDDEVLNDANKKLLMETSGFYSFSKS